MQAPHKVDLPGDFSYESTWTPMWSQATSFAMPEKLTKQETELAEARPAEGQRLDQKKVADMRAQEAPSRPRWNGPRRSPSKDIGVLEGKEKYNRDAPKDDVEKLKLLKGHVKKGQFVTKLRKVFSKDEMERRPGVRPGQGRRQGRRHRVLLDPAHVASVNR